MGVEFSGFWPMRQLGKCNYNMVDYSRKGWVGNLKNTCVHRSTTVAQLRTCAWRSPTGYPKPIIWLQQGSQPLTWRTNLKIPSTPRKLIWNNPRPNTNMYRISSPIMLTSLPSPPKRVQNSPKQSQKIPRNDSESPPNRPQTYSFDTRFGPFSDVFLIRSKSIPKVAGKASFEFLNHN